MDVSIEDSILRQDVRFWFWRRRGAKQRAAIVSHYSDATIRNMLRLDVTPMWQIRQLKALIELGLMDEFNYG